MVTLLYVPHMAERIKDPPWLFSIALANMLAIANIPREFHRGNNWLGIMPIIAGIGVPIVLTNTACVYWIFRGKVKLSKSSY